MRIAAHSSAGRRWMAAASISAVLGAVIVAGGAIPHVPVAVARADEVTISQNNLRDGWDPNEPGLSPAVVSGGTFGQLFSTPVNGQVYAQPVVAGSIVIVATENDYVYGLDTVSGAVVWSDSLGAPEPATAQGCNVITPNIGITSTPVYDPTTGTVYLVALENDGPSISQPDIYLYALDAQTGAVQWRVPIQGAPTNDPTRPFDPLSELQRPGLLLMNGSVYMAFGSYCDFEPYVGYVAGVNTSTKALTLWSDEAALTDTQGGIWQSGSGLMSDGAGRIFIATGNGVSPAVGPGTKPPEQLGDAVVRLAVSTSGTLSAADFFSPGNAPVLDVNDEDFGSGGPVGLPFGTSSYPHLLVQAGKDGRVFLLNRDNLGGREQGPGGTDADVSMTGPFGGQWGHPAAFGDTTTVGTGPSSDFVYYVGRSDPIRYLKFEQDSSGTPVLTDVANSASTFGFASGSPVVTSNGTDPSSAVLWQVYTSGGVRTGAMLEAYDAIPPVNCTAAAQCTMSPIWTAPIGEGTKFTTPATNNGIVYVGTMDGHVLGFGSPDAAPLDSPPATFGQVAVGSATTQSVTFTASAAVTVTAVQATGSGFTAGSPSLSLPVTLTAGQILSVPVTFTPTAPGGVVGALSLTTDSVTFPTVSVSLTGDGTKPGFYATSPSLSLGSQPDGVAVSATVNIINGGAGSETVTGTTPPTSPFTVVGLPATGTVIGPGQSIPATVTFLPTAVGSYTGSFTVAGADGSATVNLTGTGVADHSSLSPTPTSVSFGSVALGHQATQTIQIVNTGNITANVKTSAPPTLPFGAPDPIPAGLPINPGYDIQVPVTFTPSSTGAVAGSFRITWTDVAGTHTLSVPVSGTGIAPASGIAVPPPGGGWTLNGSAQVQGTQLVLTQAATNERGSAVYSSPVASNGLAATFTVQIGGGTGADGMTLSLLNAATSSSTSLGGAGDMLGYGGLHGVAIALDTYQNPGYPSANFVGIATGVLSTGQLNYAATATNVPDLRSGTHTVGVAVSGQQVSVTVDGTQVLDPTLPAGTIPPSVRIAFTGGTGGKDDIHAVTSAIITSGGTSLPSPGGGWSYNGSASMSGSDTVLTPATTDQAGTVIYPVPVNTSGLQVEFDAQLSGGTGADGLTFALLSPATPVTAVGGVGGSLGFVNLSGVAVALDTHQNPGYPSANFVGIAASGSTGRLNYQATAQVIPPLRIGTTTVMVQVAGAVGSAVLVVWIDGAEVLAQPEPSLGSTALLAFTGGTGDLTDVHTVRDVAIAATG